MHAQRSNGGAAKRTISGRRMFEPCLGGAALLLDGAALSHAFVPRRLLAEPLLAVGATERGARRTDKVIPCRIGFPVAAAIAVAVVVVIAVIIAVVATIEGKERSCRDRSRRCDGSADDCTRRADWPHRPAILVPGHDSVGVAEPFATIRRAALHVVLTLYVGRVCTLRTFCHGTLRHRWIRQRGGEDGGGA